LKLHYSYIHLQLLLKKSVHGLCLQGKECALAIYSQGTIPIGYTDNSLATVDLSVRAALTITFMSAASCQESFLNLLKFGRSSKKEGKSCAFIQWP